MSDTIQKSALQEVVNNYLHALRTLLACDEDGFGEKTKSQILSEADKRFFNEVKDLLK